MPKSEFLKVRVTKEFLARTKRKAEAAGVTVTDYVVSKIDEIPLKPDVVTGDDDRAGSAEASDGPVENRTKQPSKVLGTIRCKGCQRMWPNHPNQTRRDCAQCNELRKASK